MLLLHNKLRLSVTNIVW